MSERVLLKVSGEGLAGEDGFGFGPDAVRALARDIAALPALGIEVAVVNGAGNLVRGRDLPDDLVCRTTADAAGMLATVANGLILAEAVRGAGAPARVLTAVPMPDVAESFTADRARTLLAAGEVVVLAGGTGRPFFTTDTAAALRALEIGAARLLKATNVDGVYDKDPKVHADAVRFDRLTYAEAIERRLKVMDRTAFTLCEEHGLEIVVFDLRESGALAKAARGEPVGTVVARD